MTRQPVPAPLVELASFQAGVVSRDQAFGCGLSRAALARLVASGWWTIIARGIYQTSPTPTSWNGLAWAGLLVGADRARLGPRASGHLHGLLDDPPAPIDVLVPRDRLCRIDGPWVFMRERPGARTPRTLGAPPRLSVEDTVLDLAASGSEPELVSLVTRAVQRRRTSTSALLVALGQRSRHPHRQLLVSLLGDVAQGAESPLEFRYLRVVERPHGLPRGARQRRRLGLRHVSDVGYDAYQLLVELDGRAGHEADGRFRDMARDNRFAASSWLTLRYGWYDVLHHPCQVAYQVATVLAQRGWAGVPHRCPNCRSASDDDLVS
jgi:hypothetical protein